MVFKPFVWLGGKGRLLKKLLPLVPAGGRPYAEPYAGSAALFFARAPAPVEALNDLDGRIVNFYRVMQSEAGFRELSHRLEWTPYARAEFARALEMLRDPAASDVDRAWAFYVTANQGMAARSKTYGDWGRSIASASCVRRWQSRLAALDDFRARLMRAQIDQRDALEFIEYWDTEDAVFYVDPPYHPDCRASTGRYAHEVDDAHHRALVEVLLRCRGAVVLSGYAHSVYHPLEDAGWQRLDYQTVCHAAGRVRNSGLQGEGAARSKVPRIESVWRNPVALKMCETILG